MPRKTSTTTGRQRRSRIFTEEQLAIITATFPEFVEKVNEYDPRWAGNSKKLTTWKQKKINEFLDMPEFEDMNKLEGEEFTKQNEAILRLYTNYFNHNMKQKGEGKPSNFAATAPEHPAFLSFFTSASPRALFAMENDEEIKELYRKIAAQRGIPGGPARQIALKELWGKADQDEWTRRANAMKGDVELNRFAFENAMEKALNDLLQRGLLGSCAISVLFAWRDDDNKVFSQSIHTAFDADANELNDDFEVTNDEHWQKAWTNCADSIIPRKVAVVSTPLERTESGLPLFPAINLRRLSLDEIINILDDYFLALWDHIQQGATSVPWEEIEQHPVRYFDDWRFTFPSPLRRPSSLDFGEVLAVAQYLMSRSTDDPFTFHDKESIDKAVEDGKAAESTDWIPPPSPVIARRESERGHPVAAALVPTGITSDRSAAPSIAPPAPAKTPEEETTAEQGQPEASTILDENTGLIGNPTAPARKRGRPPKSVQTPKISTENAPPAPVNSVGTSSEPSAINDANHTPEVPSTIEARSKKKEHAAKEGHAAKKSVAKKAHANATMGESDISNDNRRLTKRKRTAATFGPELVSDPTKPPPKRTKPSERWTMEIVGVSQPEASASL